MGNELNKASELIAKFGNKATDVVDVVLDDINSYRYKPFLHYSKCSELGKFWRDLRFIITQNLHQ